MKIQCLIVEDEPPARNLLISYINRIEDLAIAGAFSHAMDAYAFLQKKKVDILFVDIQMPRMTGLDLIRSLHEKPRIIVTTAYRDFAADGYELDVLDYLVKPIQFERFLKAVSKFNQYASLINNQLNERSLNFHDDAYMYFKVGKESSKIYLNDIIYFESIKDYVKIITAKKVFITNQRISYLEEKLPENKFMRIHKSFIVSIGKIQSYGADEVKIDQYSLPLGRSYKQNFLKYMYQAE